MLRSYPQHPHSIRIVSIADVGKHPSASAPPYRGADMRMPQGTETGDAGCGAAEAQELTLHKHFEN